LPSSIGDLTNLNKLILHRAQIKTIPETIGNLSKLENFHLLNCAELVSLPDSLGMLRSLKTLYIWGSKITSLPESIGNIITLTNMQLQYTDIAKLPDTIGKLVNLEVLGIYSFSKKDWLGGKIDKIIEYDPDWTNYQGQNKKPEKRSVFSALPPEVSKLTKLRYLLLSNTEVTSLPDFLADLPALEKIEAINCNINTIPPSIQQLIDSKKLSLITKEKENENENT